MSSKRSKQKKKKKKATKQYTRKYLMKLSRKELQKICKKNKYKTNNKATKVELVNTILTHCKVAAVENSNVLTPSKKGEYLTSGFVRNHINSISKRKYDHQISILVGKYIGNIFMCFDVFHPKYNETVKSNGKIVERGNYNFTSTETGYGYYDNGGEPNVWILYGSSCGANNGIHEWKIKVIRNRTAGKNRADIVDGFGVTNKIKLCTKSENVYDIDTTSRKKNLFLYNFCTENEQGWYPKYEQYLKENDVMKVMLDCNKWTLSFDLNGELDNNADTIQLKPNCKYYPVILSRRNKTKYKLVKQ